MEVKVKEIRFRDAVPTIGISMEKRINAEKHKCGIVFNSDLQGYIVTFESDPDNPIIIHPPNINSALLKVKPREDGSKGTGPAR
jgi:hypothetical protein